MTTIHVVSRHYWEGPYFPIRGFTRRKIAKKFKNAEEKRWRENHPGNASIFSIKPLECDFDIVSLEKETAEAPLPCDRHNFKDGVERGPRDHSK